MLPSLIAFWRLTRPLFLLGGATTYTLGVAIAHWQKAETQLTIALLGQLFVTSVQLMTQYLNEYWDIETDRVNTSRTMFSGGSGVLAEGILPRQTALIAARASLACAGISAVTLLACMKFELMVAGLLLAIFAGAYSYSVPPMSLASRGLGEVTASLVVAGLVPALGLRLAGGHFDSTLFLATVPLILLHVSMIIVFALPDEQADRITGKGTLVVRLGRDRAGDVAHACVWAALAMLWLVPASVPSAWTHIAMSILCVIAVWQTTAIILRHAGRNIAYVRLTLPAIALFAIAAAFQTAEFIRASLNWSVRS